MIELAIHEFQKNDLLGERIETLVPDNRIERRKFMIKAGSMAMALPLIMTIVAPQAVSAQSCSGTGPAPPGNLPPPTPQPNNGDCGNYCGAGANCCSGFLIASTSPIPPGGGVCTCITVICN